MGLQSVALFLLWAYNYWPAAHLFLEQVGRWKQNSGFGFAFVASALAGAVVPLALQSLQRGTHRRLDIGALPILLVFWGFRGCIVDAFYLLQSAVWGDNVLPLTLALKVVFDLGFFSPLIGVPSVVLLFAWLDSDCNCERFRLKFEGGLLAWWKRDVLPLVPVAWVVWLSALVIIYALPVNLQFPISIIIQCFWALFLVVITDKTQAALDTA